MAKDFWSMLYETNRLINRLVSGDITAAVELKKVAETLEAVSATGYLAEMSEGPGQTSE